VDRQDAGYVTYRFGVFELDLARGELRADGVVRPLERQVFALLALLVENRERLVSKEEIVEKVWDGRVVSDSAVSSRIKSARQALGDDGKSQRCIRTIHRRGFRFVAEVRTAGLGVAAGIVVEHPAAATERAARPSIAVLAFRWLGDAGPHATLAAAMPHDLIAELSRLRWLFVTARASSFRVAATDDADAGEIGRLLGVTYLLTGTADLTGRQLGVTVQLVDTRDRGVVWADRFSSTIDDVHRVRADICARVLAALELEIPLREAGRARFTVTDNLDAWSAYHVGLQHMFRFNRRDNAAARAMFELAAQRDPGFARAYAGLSFVHFQTAFMRHTDELATEITLARRFAERGLELDPIDPFVNFTMGRSFWLEGDLEASLPWFDRAITVNPNYAQGIYARAWTESLAGRGADGRIHADLAMQLSPLDPLHYAMLGTRAFAHMDLGQDAEAAAWAERAARSPGAHVLIAMIAAGAHGLNGGDAPAAHWAANVRERNPVLTREDFFRSFPMKSEPMRARLDAALTRLGF
jgi:TolB-like protein